MKRFSILLICALASLTGACEMHKASELEEESKSTETTAEAKETPGAESPDKAKAEEKKTDDGKAGEAPKFFPEKK